jgi:hypothetical protein
VACRQEVLGLDCHFQPNEPAEAWTPTRIDYDDGLLEKLQLGS